MSRSAPKRTACTMLTSGHGESHTVPIYYGSALHHAILRWAFRDLTVSSTKILSEYGHSSSPPQKGKDQRASKRKHQCCADLTSCGALDAAVVTALAADLGLDIFAIRVSLAGCSDGRSLSVFRRLASWHVRFTVLVHRSSWSEVRTAVSNIVEDIASFALTLSGALCDQGVHNPCRSWPSSSMTPRRAGRPQMGPRPQVPPQLGTSLC